MANNLTDMMKKTREAIDSRVEKVGIDVCLGAGPLYMETDVFWEYLWVFAEREISNQADAESCLGWTRCASEYDRHSQML